MKKMGLRRTISMMVPKAFVTGAANSMVPLKPAESGRTYQRRRKMGESQGLRA